MSQFDEMHSDASQNFTLRESSQGLAALDAYDSLALARCSEIYLQALEHYIYANHELDKQHLLHFLWLYRAESAKQLNLTADILKTALGKN